MYRIVQVEGTTSAAGEDIMTYLKTKTSLNGNTEAIPFTLQSVYFETSTDTGFKINGEPEWSKLREDLVDGLYKVETNRGDVFINQFVIEDSGVSYFCKILY